MTTADNRAKVLIVDDEPLNVEVLEELLEDYHTETAYCGSEALEKAVTFQPDVVLLDVMMPGMSGLEVCETLRRDARLAHSQIVFLSAKAMPEDVDAGLAAGADDYLTKPFHHMDIVAKVEESLNAKLRTNS